MVDEREKIIEEKYVRTEVIKERGQWVVFIEVGDLESSIRHRIQAYSNERLAKIAANLIKRAAERENPFRNLY